MKRRPTTVTLGVTFDTVRMVGLELPDVEATTNTTDRLGDPLMMRSMGGITQIVPADRVASRRRMPQSLMMSAAQLGLTTQDVADIVAFLRSN